MITKTLAAEIIGYLAGCGVLIVKGENQALIWADYLNAHAGDGVREALKPDIEKATRNLVTTWQNAREYAPRISPEALASEIRKIQSARLNAVENANPEHSRINPPSDPQSYVTWEKTRRFLIAVKALPVEVAEREALTKARQTLKTCRTRNPPPARVSDLLPARKEEATHH